MTNDASRKTEAARLDETRQSDPDEFFSPRHRRKRKFGWQGVALGVGLGIALSAGAATLLPKLASKGKPETKTQQQAPPSQTVTVASAQASRIARVLNTTGTVAARDLVPVLPQANGLQVKQILVGEGQEVKAEQVMAVLDDSVLRAQIEGAKAEIESKQATVQQRQAALQQARATQADAQRTLERFQILANNGAISRQELDTRSTTAATTAEATRVAQANIGTAQADVRSSVAKLQQLQTQLGQTVVRAPVSGVVAEKIVNLGDVTNGTQKLFTLIGNGALELQAQVPATQLSQVRTGASAKITSDSDSRVSLSGTVREIAPLVNAQSRQALVRIDVPATTLLRPGMFARAAITTTTNTGVTVPNKAVQPQSDGSTMVFLLLGEDKVQARKVEVGEIVNGGNVEIKNGLKQGDRVVVAGAGYLKDGDRVRIASQ
ncbi:MAG: efflux RND transporter periplasmic adaptor subunit [Cyanobacteriota bacterium]|nr:efflux RND transporter periplasmic adaptor subunit [Cyanobacteriota bacterium]